MSAAPAVEDTDDYEESFEGAWARYKANHPEVLASYGEANGYWPKCTCPKCDPKKLRPQPNIAVGQQDA